MFQTHFLSKSIALRLLLLAAVLGLLAAATPVLAQTETVLYSFCGKYLCADGANPSGGLTMDAYGNLYGTTAYGGKVGGVCGSNGGCGTVFKVTPDGTESVLHDFYFQAPPSIRPKWVADGVSPEAGVIMDEEGNLYGTTVVGGYFPCHGRCGTVFEVTPSGSEKVLYGFTYTPDGWYPLADLIMDGRGNLYGTTAYGGNGTGCENGDFQCGTVFKVTPNGTETLLHSFTGPPDGDLPEGALVMDAQGNLYGTTNQGGTSEGCSFFGCGTVFKLTPTGEETVLYSFTGGTDGGTLYEGLAIDTQGNLYGTAAYYGAYGGGTLFKITPSGAFSVLYSFGGYSGDGWSPGGPLILDAQGNLYGTTTEGGTHFWGTVFKLAPDGTETVLYSFNGQPDGENPLAGLVMDAQHNLYGTTPSGGAYGFGAVFKLTP